MAMTFATEARKQIELEHLLAEHRIVKVDMQAEHATCIARVDMPEYGIKAGEQFELFASSYPGYAYITKDGAEGRECTCVGFEHRHGCKHVKQSSEISAARYFAHKAGNELVLEPVAVIRADDQPVHVADDLRMRRFPLSSNQAFSFLK